MGGIIELKEYNLVQLKKGLDSSTSLETLAKFHVKLRQRDDDGDSQKSIGHPDH